MSTSILLTKPSKPKHFILDKKKSAIDNRNRYQQDIFSRKLCIYLTIRGFSYLLNLTVFFDVLWAKFFFKNAKQGEIVPFVWHTSCPTTALLLKRCINPFYVSLLTKSCRVLSIVSVCWKRIGDLFMERCAVFL